ncbi:FolB domain-containing protein [Colletotrichum orchidophilum]|uniref:FolB domain-containing protein n=1 Tax=Colletotrichum orchidophilum TaxID=1209926 RepID=A0A1G4ANB5_9PEZI|nr:FolB domain-containing protein [Colletotrichum orchidophilum]OHE90669.1 FolB domain-containing protein [Colletotrichum orchidophilum]
MPSRRLVSSWQVRAEAGEPFAVIRVRDLQGTIQAGTDAWGRKNKAQPVVISAELSMAGPFEAASVSDTVSDDTVHYGLLAKALLRSLDDVNRSAETVSTVSTTLHGAMEAIWNSLTGFHVGGLEAKELSKPALLKDRIPKIRYLNVTVTLPKASLLGSGVSLSWSSAFDPRDGVAAGRFYSSCLRIHELRVPTLVGVNDNERLSRQVVVASVEIEGYLGPHDIYVDVESYIVNVLGDSSFETLEALGPAIASGIRRCCQERRGVDEPYKDPAGWTIKVIMEKPTAITMAAASCVEYRELPETKP